MSNPKDSDGVEFTDYELAEMPTCTCPGQDPYFFRHKNECALRWWHEYRSLSKKYEAVESELNALRKKS